jgi:hypothetical protein
MTTGYSRASSAGSWEAAAEWDGVFVAALKWRLTISVTLSSSMNFHTWTGEKHPVTQARARGLLLPSPPVSIF